MSRVKRRLNSRWMNWLLGTAVVVFLASSAWNVGTRINTQSSNVSSLDSIIEAQETVCLDNHALASQYRIRGEAEKALFVFFLALARQSLAKGEDNASKDFIERFAPLASQIHILPLPNCRAQAAQLRTELPPG